MSIINPKSLILSFLKPIPEKIKRRMLQTGDVTAKVKKISVILRENPELRKDSEMMKGVLALTKNSRDRYVQKFRRELISNCCCKEENGIVKITFRDFIPDRDKASIIHSCPSDKGRFDVDKGMLTFTEGAKLDVDQLWDFIQKQGVKKLVIHQKEWGTIVYGERVLQQLIKKKPSVDDLTEIYTLRFSGGDELFETKAKLLLCGGYFEGMLEHGMRETQAKAVDLSKSNVSLNGFYGILQIVETGKIDPAVLCDLYGVACEYLQFSMIPKGGFGPVEWKTHYGIEVDDAPPVPMELLNRLNEPCPFFTKDNKKVCDTHVLVLIPAGMTLTKMEELAKKPIEGYKIEKVYRYMDDKTKEKYGNVEVQESYWILMTKVPGKLLQTRSKLLTLASSVEGYEAPSLLEAAVCHFMVHVTTGKPLFGGNHEAIPCCEEPIDDKGQSSVIAVWWISSPHSGLWIGEKEIRFMPIFRDSACVAAVCRK